MVDIVSRRSSTVYSGGISHSSVAPVPVGVPQGSVLGPFLFSVYTSPISDVILSHGVHFHQEADDTQVYTAVETVDSVTRIQKSEACCVDIRD